MPCEGRAEIAGDLTGGIFFSSQRKLIRREDQKRKFLCPVLAGLSVAYVTTPTKAGLSLKSLQRKLLDAPLSLEYMHAPRGVSTNNDVKKRMESAPGLHRSKKLATVPQHSDTLAPQCHAFLILFLL